MSQVTRNNTILQSAAVIMRPLRGLLLCALAALGVTLLHSPALAAQSRFTLLTVNDLRQFVTAGYNFQESMNEYGSGKNNSTHNGLSESYSISAEYSIMHPRLLRGDASFSLVFNQDWDNKTVQGSTSDRANRITYSVSGIILDRKPYPINFNVQSMSSTIQPPFSRSYTVDSQGQTVSMSLINVFLPVVFSYSRNESTTSGLVDDIKQNFQSASINLSQKGGSLSSTTLFLNQSYDQQTLLGTGAVDSRNEFSGDIANTLYWDNLRGLHRKFGTKYIYRNQSGSSPGSQSNFGSALDWQLGKALDSRLTYDQSSNQNVLNSNNLQRASGTLTHRYLKSLQTNVGGAFSKGNYKDGSDVSTSGSLSVSYLKELPKDLYRDSVIGLDYGYQYSLQDRSRTDVVLNVFDPVLLKGTIFPQDLDLTAENIDSSTIRFYKDAGQTLPFTDFDVVFSGVLTRIRVNSNPGVTTLYLKFSYKQSPKIKYSTYGHSIGGRLALLGKRHVLNVNYSWSDVRIFSGSDVNTTLGGSSYLKAGIKSELEPHTLSLDYSSNKNVFQSIQNVDASWIYAKKLADASLLTKAQDRYSWYSNSSNSAASSQRWDNTLLLSSTYTQPILQNVKGTLTLGYFNTMTNSASSNRFNLSLNMAGSFGRTAIILDASSNWSVFSASYARNQSITLNARRSF